MYPTQIVTLSTDDNDVSPWKGEGIVIVDAGGGTIDVSTYKRTQVSNQEGRSFEEIAIPQCSFLSRSVSVDADSILNHQVTFMDPFL